MKKREVMMRTALVGLVLAIAAPVWAQAQPPSMPPPATIPDDPVKPQVILFESALRQSIDSAGRKLAELAAQVEPRLVLAPDRLADVRGIHVEPESLYYFDVLIPDLNPVAMRVVDMMRKNAPQIATPVNVPANPTSDKVAATSAGKVIEPDEMKVTGPTMATFDPTRDYSAFSREAIMTALIDLSGVLPVKEQDRVIISASGFPTTGGNPLYQQSNRKLVLTIKGSDLIELRQGKISRDEARARIKETRY